LVPVDTGPVGSPVGGDHQRVVLGTREEVALVRQILDIHGGYVGLAEFVPRMPEDGLVYEPDADWDSEPISAEAVQGTDLHREIDEFLAIF